jgi:hypothetical protein
MKTHLRSDWSSRAITGLVSVTLVVIGVIVYLSPVGSHRSQPDSQVKVVTTTMPRSPWTPSTKPSHAKPSAKQVTVTRVQVDKPDPGAAADGPVTTDGLTARATTPNCSKYKWQQDAQAVYLANLSDPYGLDGPTGPYNGNGLACDTLPTDPARAASKAVDPFTWSDPAGPSKAAVLSPSTKYFGLAADGLPGDGSLYDLEDQLAAKAPNLVEWFQYFGQSYPTAKVATAWQRKALPVITWMSAPSGYTTAADLSAYAPKAIAAGSQDAYIKTWAASIAVQKLPVVIRYDHEANGNWYPWSVGWKQQGISGTTTADYVAAWRHVWQIFSDYGANDYAIWAYVPSRIDTLPTYGTGLASQAAILQASYPGDKYVDWVGMDGYQFNADESTTATDTFAATLGVLESFAAKPVFIAEMGSAESAIKPGWITDAYAKLAADPNVVAVTYFDNDVNGVHTIDNKPVRTNWRIDSSTAALNAFRRAVANPAYGSGLYPPYLIGN